MSDRMDEHHYGAAADTQPEQDAKTPFLALGGTALAIFVLFVVALGVVSLAYVLGRS